MDLNYPFFADKLGISLKKLEKFTESSEFKNFELGKYDETEFVHYLSENKIFNKEQIVLLKNKPLLKFLLREKTYKLIQQLKHKYNIFLLSNTNSIDFLAIDKWLNLRKIFKKCYLTYEQHYLKPSIEVYKHAEQYFGINVNETLFLDDKIDNINGAKKCGWNTIWVTSENELISKLKSNGII